MKKTLLLLSLLVPLAPCVHAAPIPKGSAKTYKDNFASNSFERLNMIIGKSDFKAAEKAKFKAQLSGQLPAPTIREIQANIEKAARTRVYEYANRAEANILLYMYRNRDSPRQLEQLVDVLDSRWAGFLLSSMSVFFATQARDNYGALGIKQFQKATARTGTKPSVEVLTSTSLLAIHFVKDFGNDADAKKLVGMLPLDSYKKDDLFNLVFRVSGSFPEHSQELVQNFFKSYANNEFEVKSCLEYMRKYSRPEMVNALVAAKRENLTAALRALPKTAQ